MKHEKKLNLFIMIFFRGLTKRVADVLVKFPITANMITCFGLFLVIPMAYLLSSGKYLPQIIGAFVAYVIIFVDYLDGEIARRKNIATIFGDWLDAMVDEIREFVIILSLGIGVYKLTGNHIYLLLAYVMMASDALIMRVVEKFYKIVSLEKHIDEINIQVKKSAILPIIKQLVSVRVMKFMVLPFFAIFGALALYIKIFTCYSAILALGFLFYYSIEVWRREKGKKY